MTKLYLDEMHRMLARALKFERNRRRSAASKYAEARWEARDRVTRLASALGVSGYRAHDFDFLINHVVVLRGKLAEQRIRIAELGGAVDDD